ncbi:MAG TPA: SAF domain-containing protein [Acidimicrobiales bacterium]|nr:SAF domain-containing protein [Acidimicrobiales bacterium]
MDGGQPARLVRRRRPLPGGRAITGGFLVALAAVGVFAAASHTRADRREPYVVARHDLRVGSRIGPSDVGVERMQLSTGLATRRAFHRTAQVVGAVVVGPVGSGELIQAASLASHAGPRESRQVSLPIDAARAVGGRLVAGDIVDVAATLGAGGSAETTWIVRRHVLAARLGRTPTNAEVAAYWRPLIEANRHSLVRPNDPGLLFAGQDLVLP